MNLKNEVKKNAVLIVTLPSQKYNKSMLTIINQLSTESVRYVTLNKTKDALMTLFKSNKINSDNICFIDGITNIALKTMKSTPGCFFLKSPNDLKSLDLHLSRDNRDVIIFDSLSTLLIYESLGTVTKFVKDIIKKLGKRRLVMIAIDGEKEKVLRQNLKGSIGKIIDIK